MNCAVKPKAIEFIFLNFKEAKSVTAKSIRNYNQKRPHAVTLLYT